VKKKIAKQLRQRKRKIRNRLDKRTIPEHLWPMLNPGNIHYEISDRNHGVLYGGMGAVQMLVRRLGLDEAINRHLRLFKLHNPYYESDHVLNIYPYPLSRQKTGVSKVDSSPWRRRSLSASCRRTRSC